MAAGKPLEGMVGSAVADYIKAHHIADKVRWV